MPLTVAAMLFVVNGIVRKKHWYNVGLGSAKCEAACPKEISIEWIARMNKHYLKAPVTSRSET